MYVCVVDISSNPSRIVRSYTESTIWRNRSTFIKGHEQVMAFLSAKWKREASYRLRKELFAFGPDRIAVQFWYEYQDREDGMAWKRCYGLEDWTFETEGDEAGKMRKRQMSGNDVVIGEIGRWFTDDVEDVNAVEIGEEHW